MASEELIFVSMHKLIRKRKRLEELFFHKKKVYGVLENTIDSYKFALDLFYEYIEHNLQNKIPIGTEDFILYMRNKKMRNSTISQRLSVISNFIKIIHKHNYLSVILIEYIRIKDNTKAKPLISDSVYNEIRNGVKPIYILMFETLAFTGIRISELVKLQVKHVMHKDNIISGKGEHERRMFIADYLYDKLQNHIKENNLNKNDYLFISNHGTPFNRKTLNFVLKPYGVTPHDFRHKCANDLLKKGVPVEDIQLFLGHKDINTTMKYVRASQQNIMVAINS